MLFLFSNSQSCLISQLDKENPFKHAVDDMFLYGVRDECNNYYCNDAQILRWLIEFSNSQYPK